MEEFLRTTLTRTLAAVPTTITTNSKSYIEFLKETANQANLQLFPGNSLPTLPEHVTKGLEFISSNFPSPSATAIKHIKSLCTKEKQNTSSPDNNTNTGSSTPPSPPIEFINNSLLYLELLSSVESLCKTLVLSLRQVTRYFLQLSPISTTFQSHLQDLILVKKELNRAVCITCVCLQEELVPKLFGLKIIEIILSQHNNKSSTSSPPPPTPEAGAGTSAQVSSTVPTTITQPIFQQQPSAAAAPTNSKAKKSWQEFTQFILLQDPITNANICRLAYLVGIGIRTTETLREKLEFIENHLYSLLESKSYLHHQQEQVSSSAETSSSSSSLTPDSFLYTLATTICLCPNVKNKFQALLLRCVEERLQQTATGGSEKNSATTSTTSTDATPTAAADSSSSPNNTNDSLAMSLRILTYEALQLLQFAKIRNKLCNEFTKLKERQGMDGSWPASFAKRMSSSSSSSGDDVSINESRWRNGGGGGTRSRNWKNDKLITTIFALKAIHAFNEHRLGAFIGNSISSKLSQHIIT